jgi:uncharacterized membrane protein YedE/YeeE
MNTSSKNTPNPLFRAGWNPYIVGAGIGVLSMIVFLIVDKPLGMSTEVSKWSGWLASIFSGSDAVADNPYWAKTKPAFGYSTVFLVATFLGALLSAKLGGTFRIEKVPTVWGERFGGSVGKRMVAAFAGGFVILYGARMAGGCTSGHGISGTLQLAVSGWVFFAVMFAAGIATAKLMFTKKATVQS